MNVQIPAKKNLIPLNFEYIDDTIDQYYRPIQGYFMRKRLDLALKLIAKDIDPDKKVDKILDIGYGGGTFLVSLSKLARKVSGIDLHDEIDSVHTILDRENVKASLYKASALDLPFENNSFDTISCISVLEHFTDQELDRSLKEIKRVLKPNGKAVIGFPTKNFISNFIIKHILGFEPSDIHPSGHTEIFSAIGNNWLTFNYISYPNRIPLSLALYVVVELTK
jgi:ubiquinone/menaquinone biosynthesis C-methylase UbiE